MARSRGGVVAAAAAAVMWMVAGNARSAESGVYAAFDIGPTSLGVKESDLAGPAAAALDDAGLTADLDSSFDKKALGVSVAWGYRFSPYLAVEASLISLGKAKWRAEGTVNNGTTDLAGDLGVTVKSSGPVVAALGSWPLGERFSVDARAGVYLLTTKRTLSYAFGPPLTGESANDTDSDHETGLAVGLGGTWYFTPSVALRVGYTRFAGAIGKRDVDRIAAGFQYSIGK
jgi:opacity protein-like surface antigen